MKKYNHFSSSFALSLYLFFYVFNYDILLTLFLSFVVAFLSFLPDVDLKILSKIDNFNKETFYLFFPVTFLLKLFFKHRGITHSIWIPLFLFLIGEFILDGIYTMIFRVVYLAFFLHIFEDSFTVSGVQIFFPHIYRFKLFNFTTSSKIDSYFLELFAYLLVFLFVFLYI